ncbi:hypothetical protein SH449x_001761 [Pirellulaceae bacterium SH449]
MLRRLIAQHDSAAISLLVGGGDIVEGVRSLHKVYPNLDQAALHWHCVNLLNTTCEIAAQLLPVDGVVQSYEDFGRWTGESRPLTRWVKASSFYSPANLEDTIPQLRLATDWSTTTDALAVLLGIKWHASHVLLLKSCDVDQAWSLEQAAALGVIDSETPRIAKHFTTGSISLIPFFEPAPHLPNVVDLVKEPPLTQ